jgi:hypothetical protein
MSTSPRHYKNQQSKDLSSQDSFSRPKTMVRSSTLEGERKARMKRWITFFRRNPNYLIRDYFGITLFPNQILMIWALQKSTLAYIVAARAAAKTFIIAIWALTLAVLYPGIKIITVSKTLKQGSLIIGKIEELRHKYSNIDREIEKLTINPNNAEVVFYDGSTIKAVPSSESARGNRANYVIVEESRLVSKEILESVIKPFLEVRMPPYMKKDEYKNDKDLKEEGIISYITSAGYKAEYWYTYVVSCIKKIAAGDETSNFLAFDYLNVVNNGTKTDKMIKDEMEDTDDLTVQLEYYNIPSGASGKSYFKPTLFNRNIKRAFYPFREDNYGKKNKYEIKKVDGEIRIVSIDIATRANKANDNSIISCIQMIPILGKGYERRLTYMESFKGRDADVQARRIKDIFFDFEADYIVMDIQNAGIGIFESLTEPTICEDRGITYPALGIVDSVFDFIKNESREELVRLHTRSLNPIPVIFPISASQELNSQIASSFRASLQKKLWSFLVTDGDAEDYLLRSVPEFTENADNSDLYAWFLQPYVNINLFISECVNLDLSLVGGKIKLQEKAGNYKDRYTSVSYANWIISMFDHELLKEGDGESDDFAILASLAQGWG